MSQSNKNITIVIVIAIVAIAAAAYIANNRKEPTAGEKIGNAVDKLGDGVKDASRELKSDRGPVEKMGEAIEDAGDKIQEKN